MIAFAFFFADPPFFERYYSRLWHQDRSGIFYLTTDFGRSEWMLWGSGGLMAIMAICAPVGGEKLDIAKWHHQFMKLCFIFTAVAFAGLISLGLKLLIGRARPVGTLPQDGQWNTLSIFDVAGHASFPSGHSTAIGAFCMAMALLFPRLRVWLLFLALWVGSTRVIVGAHFPSDVVAGLSFGSLFAWTHARNFARRRLLFRFEKDGTLVQRVCPGKSEPLPIEDRLGTLELDANAGVKARPEA